MDSRKSKSTKRELTSHQIFKKMFISQFNQYKTTVLEYISEKEKPEKSQAPKATKVASTSSASRNILRSLSFGADSSPTKLRKYQQARDLMNREEFSKEVNAIAKLLGFMYQDLLDRCTHQSAIIFANTCVEFITTSLEKNKVKVDALLQESTLQALLVRLAKESPPKKKLTMTPTAGGGERDVDDAIIKPVLYCAENKVFYKCPNSSASEFGFVQVESLEEILMLQNNLFEFNKKYEYRPMQEEISKLLRKGSFLKGCSDDDSSDLNLLTPRSDNQENERENRNIDSSDEKMSRSVS